jgi:hypothetical protein
VPVSYAITDLGAISRGFRITWTVGLRAQEVIRFADPFEKE